MTSPVTNKPLTAVSVNTVSTSNVRTANAERTNSYRAGLNDMKLGIVQQSKQDVIASFNTAINSAIHSLPESDMNPRTSKPAPAFDKFNPTPSLANNTTIGAPTLPTVVPNKFNPHNAAPNPSTITTPSVTATPPDKFTPPDAIDVTTKTTVPTPPGSTLDPLAVKMYEVMQQKIRAGNLEGLTNGFNDSLKAYGSKASQDSFRSLKVDAYLNDQLKKLGIDPSDSKAIKERFGVENYESLKKSLITANP